MREELASLLVCTVLSGKEDKNAKQRRRARGGASEDGNLKTLVISEFSNAVSGYHDIELTTKSA